MANCCTRCVRGCRFVVDSLDFGLQIELFGSKEWKLANKEVNVAKTNLQNGEITLDEFRAIDCLNRKKMISVARDIDRRML